jgi:hypothetical protein
MGKRVCRRCTLVTSDVPMWKIPELGTREQADTTPGRTFCGGLPPFRLFEFGFLTLR